MDKVSIKSNLLKILEEATEKFELAQFGITPLERPITIEFYAQWLKQGYHGDMSYLSDHYPIKNNPQSLWKKARTAIVFTAPYGPLTPLTSINTSSLNKNSEKFPLTMARVSLYAQGTDYHRWFLEKLNNICDILKNHFPHEIFICGTDSIPLLERDLAVKSGIGWVGKNTCVISKKKGSLFFLGEIITSLDIHHETINSHDHCGTCSKCIDICPTQALVKPRTLDARKCISYLTIESKKIPPIELREKIGDWFFGCDLCQTVCPWNAKILKHQLNNSTHMSQTRSLGLEERRKVLVDELKLILTSSNKKLEKQFRSTPLSRARGWGLKRNALIVVANQGLTELTPYLRPFLADHRLKDLAQWAISELCEKK